MTGPSCGTEIPENLCIIPFIHIGTKPDGVARVCCMAPDLEVSKGGHQVNLHDNSIAEVWNSEYMKNLRKRMLKGEKLKECSACWTQESRGPHSKRLRENKKYLQKNSSRLKEAAQNDGFITESPSYFDLRLGNRCNLKCRTCNPIFSRSWQKELKSHSLSGFKGQVRNEYQYMFDRSEKLLDWYGGDFFQQLNEILPNLREIYISGGEPLLIPELETFLEHCEQTNLSRNIEVRLNSNISVLNEKFYRTLLKFKRVNFGASIDALGEKNDWLRPPSRWNKIVESLNYLNGLSRENKNFELSVNITVSVYNFYYVSDLVLWLKENYPEIPFILDFVSKPEYMSLDLVPPLIATAALEKLNSLFDIHLSEKEIIYLEQLRNSIVLGAKKSSAHLFPSFVNHTETVDGWRNESAKGVFPELFSFFEGPGELSHF